MARGVNKALIKGSRKVATYASAHSVRGKLLTAAKAEQAKTSRKLNRLTKKGIDVSSLDQRRDLSSMSSRQLRKHIDALQSFNKNRGYVAGANGQPINRAAYDVLKKQEREHNKQTRAYVEGIGNIVIPELGRDINSVIDDRTGRYSPGGENATYEERNRPASGINGQSAIMDLINDMRKKISPGYLSDRMAEMRENLRVMFDTINDPDAQAKINELTDHQLDTLVNYNPEFMRAMGARYDYMKAMNLQEQDEPENWMTELYETNSESLHEMLDWAHDELPETPRLKSATTQKPRDEFTNTNAGPIKLPFTNTDVGSIPVQRSKRKPGTGKSK